MLTPNEIESLVRLIDVHVDTFIGNTIGTDYLTEEQKARLRANGIYVKPQMTLDTAFKMGMLSDMLGRQSEKMTYNQMLVELKKRNFLPLSFNERKAVERLRYQAYSEIRGLGNKIALDTGRIMIEADKAQRARMEGIIRSTAEDAVLNRKSVKEMSSMLGHKTGDWARDFDRISDYILHDAHDHGRAAQIERMNGPKGNVYKRVYDQACPHCVRLYLTNGAGSEPRRFTVNELRANGSNVGRKASEYKAVIGPTHPWCFSDDTEVMTESGWKLFKDVSIKENILSVNLDSGDAEFVGIKQKVEYAFKGDLWHYEKRGYDVLCTPNHKHPVKFRKRKGKKGDRYENWHLVAGTDLPKNDFWYLRTVQNWVGQTPHQIKIGDVEVDAKDYCEFMGYYLSEGSISKKTNRETYMIKITQHGRKYDVMKDCCIRIFGKVWEAKEYIGIPTSNESVIQYLTGYGHSFDKSVPNQIKQLDREHIEIFLNAYLMGDGTTKKGSNWKGYQFSDEKKFYTSSPKMSSDLGELILKCGGVPTYSVHKPVPKNHKNGTYTAKYDQWHVTWCKGQVANSKNVRVTPVQYDGNVYCLELEKYHTLFVRRNGKVTLSGNCRCPIGSIPNGATWNDTTQDWEVELTESQKRIAKLVKFELTPD